LVSLAHRLHDGNVQQLAEHINKFFQQVAADLCPLSVAVEVGGLYLPHGGCVASVTGRRTLLFCARLRQHTYA